MATTLPIPGQGPPGVGGYAGSGGINTPNDSTINSNPPLDFNSMANSLSYISAQTPEAAPLVNILTQQIGNYVGNWKYYQQNIARQTAGMPTGQAADFMAQQGLQYSMQSLNQLQNLITNVLPYMTQSMILKFQDKWFQQEQQMKQAEMQSQATAAAYQQLNNQDPNNPFSAAGMNRTTQETEANNMRAMLQDQQGKNPVIANQMNPAQAAAKYMQGQVFQGMGSNGMATFVDPNTGNVSQYAFDPNAGYGQNPFTQSSNLTAGQMGSTLAQLATQGANNAMMQGGASGGFGGFGGAGGVTTPPTGGLQGTTQQGQQIGGSMDFLPVPQQGQSGTSGPDASPSPYDQGQPLAPIVGSQFNPNAGSNSGMTVGMGMQPSSQPNALLFSNPSQNTAQSSGGSSQKSIFA